MDVDDLWKVLKRDSAAIFSEETLGRKLQSGKKLRVKLGADPSRPDLHLGHTVVLRKLKMFQDQGHEIVFVIGDFTGMIGDPSGKSKTRKPLTFEETRKNGESYFKQVVKILDPEKTIIRYNSEWLGRMNFTDVLSLAGKYTLARILERDDFAKRHEENSPIGLHEIFYPLMQGYDSVALHADIEVGGTDQTFNLLVGRDLQRDYGQEPQDVVTFPLLPGLDGIEKMSKSLGNYIGIDEPAEIMFEKCMKVPDPVLKDYFRLTTDLAPEIFEPLIERDIREAHLIYAREIVRLYHSQADSIRAEKRYLAVAAGRLPENIDVLILPEKAIGIIDLLRSVGFASSGGDARRLIAGGGISADGEKVTDSLAVLSGKSEIIVCKGKNKYVKVVFHNETSDCESDPLL